MVSIGFPLIMLVVLAAQGAQGYGRTINVYDVYAAVGRLHTKVNRDTHFLGRTVVKIEKQMNAVSTRVKDNSQVSCTYLVVLRVTNLSYILFFFFFFYNLTIFTHL